MIENTLAALKAIDITGAIRRDEDYKAEKAQIEDAISAGQARAQAIRDEIRDAEKAGGVDGEAVADAMLRGEVIEAISVEKLQKELDTINAGLRTLNQRMYASIAPTVLSFRLFRCTALDAETSRAEDRWRRLPLSRSEDASTALPSRPRPARAMAPRILPTAILPP